jgi:hypothetical protein
MKIDASQSVSKREIEMDRKGAVRVAVHDCVREVRPAPI